MKIYNLASINIDYFYQLDRLPKPGETLSSESCHIYLGGKGMNISVAIQRSGGEIKTIGAVGNNDSFVRKLITSAGIDDSLIADVNIPTGHAIIYVDQKSENCIVITGGANQNITEKHLQTSLSLAQPGDWLLMQNETNAHALALTIAREKGMKIALVAAPFDLKTLPDLIQKVDLVSMNESETNLFEETTGHLIQDFPKQQFLITYGAKGASFFEGGDEIFVKSHKVKAVDTTGAGDTFFGAFMVRFTQGAKLKKALNFAAAAAALKIQKFGTTIAIPNEEAIEEFLRQVHT